MKSVIRQDTLPIVGGAALLLGLYLTSLYSYLLFHSLVEIITVAISWAVFFLAWNSRRVADNQYLLFVGIGWLFVGLIDLLHTLAYRGMGVFATDGANLATQLWIAGRYLQSISLLLAPLFLTRKLNAKWTVAAFGVVVTALLASIFVWKIFPDSYIEGQGLTPFKVVSEYVVIGIYIAAVLFLRRHRYEFDPQVRRHLTAAIGLTIVAELAFTLYISVYDISNLTGHLIRLAAGYFLYRAIIVNGLVRPYDLLFRDLIKTDDSLRNAMQSLQLSEQSVRRKLDSILMPEGSTADLELADVMDTTALQSLMDHFYPLARIPMSVVDLKGRVLVGVGWQTICTEFHRRNPAACAHCVESDLHLTEGVPPGEFRLYKCKNNMWDVATPIMVGGRKVGNAFSGQFFFEDEPVDRQVFIHQARQYGFDEKTYLAALDAVPRLSRASVQAGMGFLIRLADLVSKLSYNNLKLARTVEERNALTRSVEESREALRRVNCDLEQRNADLEMANKELEAFSYSVSHDLRAPVAVIDGFAQLMLQDMRDELPETAQSYLNLIHKSATGMTQLIRDLLSFSRMTRQTIRKEHVVMTDLVREVLKSLEVTESERTVQVTVGDLPDAAADRVVLKQVWTNLLANAFKFTRTREVARIEIGYAEREGQGAYYVRDNGVGFDMEQAGKLFGVFQRMHREDEYEGTGVGLAIVERVIRRHGGRVWADAAVDRGATFYFTIPSTSDTPLARAA